MLGFGLLGLFGIGMAMSMGGDGDDDLGVDALEQTDADAEDSTLIQTDEALSFFEAEDTELQDLEDDEELNLFLEELLQDDGDASVATAEETQSYDATIRNALIQSYVKIGEVDAETQSRITEYLDGLDPSQPIDAAASDYKAFVTSLGVEVIEPSAEEEAARVFDDPDLLPYDNELRNTLLLSYVPVEDADEETMAQITAWLDDLPDEQDIHEAALAFRDFVSGLGLEVPELSDDMRHPPTGENFRDPLIIAEELEAQRQPENLVTVSDDEGAEVDDLTVLAENTATADPDAPRFVVTAPEGENEIEVRFDAEHTFQIEFNAETLSVIAGLNSDIDGPDGTPVSEESVSTDENDVEVRTVTWTRQFEDGTDITLNVQADHIGLHTSQIDLTNPDDTLHFEFGPEVTGALHLVFYEAEENTDSDSSTSKRAVVIHTETTGTGTPTAADVAALLEADGPINGVSVLSEIYLGTDSVDINGDPEDQEPYEIWLSNFINDAPLITSNLDWASVTEADDNAQSAAQGGSTGSGSGGGSSDPGDDGEGDGDDEDEIRDLFLSLGLNPGFFGF